MSALEANSQEIWCRAVRLRSPFPEPCYKYRLNSIKDQYEIAIIDEDGNEIWVRSPAEDGEQKAI